ncbi:Uncharacterised protein [Mycobacterium tuberculosis]|uniref:Uncharacterized protein n=1 Tax=Mycobacterium tuberculosis TaxID=1773 RepID=A0A0U0T644_MYCTX|nr:Uncharacterised protein [Mycobacterium tuberculosis]COY59460.1 Uncharacterised protein [Mycobacterium tuberculosis]
MARNTEYMGSRLLYGFWNTGWTRRRKASTWSRASAPTS